MTWFFVYLTTWLTATVLSILTTAACRRIAPRWGFVDRPKQEAHKSHREPTAVLGGLGMLTAWLLTLVCGIAAVLLFTPSFSDAISCHLPGLKASLPKMTAIALGAAAFTALGIIDDKHALKANRKFLGQFIIAAAIVSCGIRLTLFVQNPVFGWIATILWIMTVINALNFFDNMDGLAGGTAAIAAFFLFFVAAIRGQYFVALLSSVTGGAALGFLAHNKPPAKIFMGDGGSHFLGFCLAIEGLLTTFYLPSESPTPAPVLIPLFILSLPLFDAIAVVIIRIRLHKPIYVGDNRHISHRFVNLGLTRPQAVCLVYLLNIIQGAGATALLWLPAPGFLLILMQTAALFLLVSIIQFHVKIE